MEDRLQIIDFANRIFGAASWSFSISNVAVDYMDENQSGQFSTGASVVVRVQRANGAFREEVGCGACRGPTKSEVISKAKKAAVTEGLKGALINFGSDIAKQLNCLTHGPTESKSANSETFPQNSASNIRATSPLQATVKPSPASKADIGGQTKFANQTTSVLPPTSSAVVPKVSPIPNRVAPVPRGSGSPLAAPLPQSTNQHSEEELAKQERKRRQRQLQEEFRKKHLLEQAQAQKASEKPIPKVAPQQPRAPLKEQQSYQHPKEIQGGGISALDGEEDVLLSTQDMEAMVEIAANTTNMSRRSPLLSSPSIARSSGAETVPQHRSGQKRTDLSSFAFNPEKKARGT